MPTTSPLSFEEQFAQRQNPPLIRTKLEAPALAATALRRPRLVEGLQRGGWRVAVITGGAGTGKTVAVRQWLDTETPGTWTWIGLDGGDSPQERFWPYVLAALDRCAPGRFAATVGALLDNGAHHPGFLPTLLNEATALETPVTLVLDDLHALTDATTLDSLRTLVMNGSTFLRVVAISRREPRWPLTRWRGSPTLVEIRHDDLAFTRSEIEAFLAGALDRPVEASDLDALRSCTEGWAATVQLAALAMRTDDPASVVRRFGDVDVMVAELIASELIGQLSDDRLDFLLRTSVLDVLDAESCDAVTGRTDSAQQLEQLAGVLPFLHRLDGFPTSFRCHHLLREMLRAELRGRFPQLVGELHRIAGVHALEQGDAVGAIGHLLAAGDMDGAFHLAIGRAVERHDHAELASTEAWVNAFPNEYVASNTARMIQYAFAVGLCGKIQEALAWLDRADRRGAADPVEAEVLARLADSVRLTIDAVHDEFPDGLACGRRALAAHDRGADLGPTGRRLRLNLARVHILADEPARAAGVLDGANTDDDVVALFLTPACRARIALRNGELRDAETLARSALAGAAAAGVPHHGGTIEAHLAIGGVLTDRGDLDAATVVLATAGDLARRYYFHMLSVLCRLDEVRAHAAQHGPDAALATVEELRAACTGHSWPNLERAIDRVESRWLIEAGELGRAAALISELPGDSVGRAFLEARLDLAEGRPDAAVTRLESFEPGNRRDRLTAALLCVRAALEGASIDPAPNADLAVQLAAGDGLVLPCREEGPATLRLVRTAALHQTHSTSRRLAARLGATSPKPSRFAPANDLSDREKALLPYLSTRLTNQEIAAELFVSINTVKTQLKSIYRKLGVTSRSAAVERARQVGML